MMVLGAKGSAWFLGTLPFRSVQKHQSTLFKGDPTVAIHILMHWIPSLLVRGIRMCWWVRLDTMTQCCARSMIFSFCYTNTAAKPTTLKLRISGAAVEKRLERLFTPNVRGEWLAMPTIIGLLSELSHPQWFLPIGWLFANKHT